MASDRAHIEEFYALFNKNSIKEAVQVYETFIDGKLTADAARAKMLVPDLYGKLAEQLVNAGKIDDAKAALNKASKTDPNSALRRCAAVSPKRRWTPPLSFFGPAEWTRPKRNMPSAENRAASERVAEEFAKRMGGLMSWALADPLSYTLLPWPKKGTWKRRGPSFWKPKRLILR